MVLKDLYEEKLRKYQDTGEMEDPNSMLALLLLDKKDEFFPIDANIKHFYQDYMLPKSWLLYLPEHH